MIVTIITDEHILSEVFTFHNSAQKIPQKESYINRLR